MHDTDTGDGFSMDSFLDIVTNVVGLMILLALIVVLSFGQFHLELGTPMLHPPTEGATALGLECRGKALYDLDMDETLEKARTIWTDTRHDGDTAARQAIAHADLHNRHYRVELIETAYDHPNWRILPRDEAQCFSIASLSDPNGGYLRKLDTVSPRERFLFFVVRPDSYETFRTARKIARDRGFEVGWLPFSIDGTLMIGRGGSGPDNVPQ